MSNVKTLFIFRQIFEQNKGKKDLIQKELKEARNKIKYIKEEINITQEAQIIIQTVARQTQKQIQIHISGLVSTALELVFHNPYKFKLDFVIRRNKTECDLLFERDGISFHPLTASGGGVIDVASFALRVALLSLKRPKSRMVLILDEPFKNINDPDRVIHSKIAEMVKILSKKLGIQIIMTSLIPEIQEIADKIFLVEKKKRLSTVRVVDCG